MRSRYPEDTLVIHYTSLSPDPLIRLEVIAAIGRLLDSPASRQHLTNLTSSPGALLALCSWLRTEGPGRFWGLEMEEVIPRSTCQRHIIVGTRQLLRDLASLDRAPGTPRLSEVDWLWRAASVLIEEMRSSPDSQ